MHVDGAVANDHFITPYLVEDLVAQEDATGFQGQQVEQFKFFFGKDDFLFK